MGTSESRHGLKVEAATLLKAARKASNRGRKAGRDTTQLDEARSRLREVKLSLHGKASVDGLREAMNALRVVLRN